MAVKKRKPLILPILISAAVVALVFWTAWGNAALELNTYTVTSNRLPTAFDGYRIAQISDLHNSKTGHGSRKLLAMLREAKPDIIVITGDLIDSRRTDIDTALQFAEEAVKIAPCYYATGNHESRITEYGKLKEDLTALGVVTLENERITLEHDGMSIALLGLTDPSFVGDYMTPNEAVINAELCKLVNANDEYTVLLSHRPEFFELYAMANVDLVLSGHAHGGQIRLPFIGGLFAPGQGIFPKYDAGLYTEGATNMIVSRGIGNSLFPFRFNNRPEVVVAELRVCE